jgi:type II secretory pathway component PulF
MVEATLIGPNGRTEVRLYPTAPEPLLAPDQLPEAPAVVLSVRALGPISMGRYRLRSRERGEFARRLVQQIRAGTGLYDSLNQIAATTNASRIRAVLCYLIAAFDRGAPFEVAVSNAAALLGPSLSSLILSAHHAVQAGPPTRAAAIIQAEARQAELVARTTRAVVQSLIYPALLYGATVLAGALALFVLLPRMGAALGLGPQELAELTWGMRFSLVLLVLPCVPAALIAAAHSLRRSPALPLEQLALRLPVVGTVLRLRHTFSLVTAARISRFRGTSAAEGIRLFGRLAGSGQCRTLAGALAAQLETGRPAAVPGEQRHAVDRDTLAELLAVLARPRGDDALHELGRAVQERLETVLERTKRLAEPIAHGAIALVVGGMLLGTVRVVLAMYERIL